MTTEKTAPDNPGAAPVKLSFGATFRAGFGAVFGDFGAFLRMAAVPLLLSTAILLADFTLRAMTFVGVLPLDPEGLGAALLELLVGLLALLPFAFLGISLTRRRLLGGKAGFLPKPLLGRRTWVYAGYLLLLSTVLIVLAVAGVLAGIALLQATSLSSEVGAAVAVIAGVAGSCAVFYLVLRLSLVLPTTALDTKLGLKGSWRLTRRSGLKLLGVFLLLFLANLLAVVVGSLVFGDGNIRIGTPELVLPEGSGAGSDWRAIVLANLPRNLWNLAANFLIFAMACGALTSAYAQLGGWDKPREDILERFD